MLLDIDFQSKKSLYLQVKEQLRKLILDGSLAFDSKLPSTRELATALKISRNTVNKVYEELLDEGYLETRMGTGTYVCYKSGSIERSSETDESGSGIRNEAVFDWEERINNAEIDSAEYLNRLRYFHPESKGVISFTNSRPLPEFYAFERFRKCLNDILTYEGGKLLDYGPTLGYLPLREYLVGYLKNKGINVTTDEIMIVNGFQQGSSLLSKLLLKKGDCVATEDPTHANAIATFRSSGARVLGVPTADPDGIDTVLLDKTLKEEKPSLLYLIPSNHNPTGLTMSLHKRLELMKIIEKYNIPVIEDAFSEELRFSGQVVPSLKALDKRGQVVYIGSFSKILFPGIRVGWVVAPVSLMNSLECIKRLTDISTSLLTQASLYEFCRRGYFDNEIKRVRKIYRTRLNAVLNAMTNHMPREVSWTGGTGGFSIWVTLPRYINAEELLEKSRKRGVVFIPGRYFSTTREENCLRLSFSSLSPEDIDSGIKILAECILDSLQL